MTRKQILKAVAHDHKLAVRDIVGPMRFADYVAARRDAIFRMRSAGHSLRAIAMTLRRDPSTITHHCYPIVRVKKAAKAALRYQQRKLAA